ncbi:MAG: GtrA family protein [Succinivibrio sp.]|nr:GtrA family protein [Succinivibrio sp.]
MYLFSLEKKLSSSQLSELRKIIRFGLVGVSSTLLSYAIFLVSVYFLEKFAVSYDYIYANLIAFLLSVLWAFYWHRNYVFNFKGTFKDNLIALLKCYASYAFSGIVLTNAFSILLIEYFGISKYLAILLILFITIPVNFLLNRLWAFRTPKK